MTKPWTVVLTKDSCCSENVGTMSVARQVWCGCLRPHYSIVDEKLPRDFCLCGLQDRTYMQYLEAAAMKLPVLPNEMNSIAHMGLQGVARPKICQMHVLAA